jgi:hypothetical protein
MEKELKWLKNNFSKDNKLFDFSYEWILKDSNIEILNRSVQVDLNNMKSIIENRDMACEFKV